MCVLVRPHQSYHRRFSLPFTKVIFTDPRLNRGVIGAKAPKIRTAPFSRWDRPDYFVFICLCFPKKVSACFMICCSSEHRSTYPFQANTPVSDRHAVFPVDFDFLDVKGVNSVFVQILFFDFVHLLAEEDRIFVYFLAEGRNVVVFFENLT